jgi:hypothetical protein
MRHVFEATDQSGAEPTMTEAIMINVQTAGAALALALAVAAIATPALAKSGAQRGHAARAQAIEVMDEGVSAARAKTLRECSGRIAGFKGYNQMATPLALYRTCMEDHGEPE